MLKSPRKIENKFVKNIVMLTSGTAFAQVLTILVSPVLTRIYSPHEFGVLSVYASVLALLSIIVSLDYQKAIPLIKDDYSAYNLIAGSFSIIVGFVITLFLVFLILGEQLFTLLNVEVLLGYIYFIPLGVLFVAVYNVLTHWSLRAKDFKTLTHTKITQSLMANAAKITFGLLGFSSLGLILGHIIGQSGGVYRLSKSLIDEKDEFIKSLKWEEIKSQLYRYIKFPIFSAPSNYIYAAGTQAPVLFLIAIFGASASGYYSLANSIVSLPISLLAMSVSQVFYTEAASIGKTNPNEIKKLSLKLSAKLALIGIFPLLAFVFFGPFLFSIVFGQNWYEAGVYARVLAFLSYVHFVIMPIGRILEIIEKQNIGLFMNIFRLILIIFSFVLAIFFDFSPLQTIILYALVNAVSYLLLYFVVQKELSK